MPGNVVDFRKLLLALIFMSQDQGEAKCFLLCIFFLSPCSLMMSVVLKWCHSPCLFEVSIGVYFCQMIMLLIHGGPISLTCACFNLTTQDGVGRQVSPSQFSRGGGDLLGGSLSHQVSGPTTAIKTAVLSIFSPPAHPKPCRSGLCTQP